jgi:Mismatch repair ATPase (MutS family)
MLNLVYKLDVYIAVAETARKSRFTYADVSQTENENMNIIGLRHPAIRDAVDNTVCFSECENMIFLTGANMAGKSTLMKSVGIALYLAHMGFPIAADRMSFRVMDGLFTSINIADNINKGYSHFYAEVLRVKTVVTEVTRGRRLMVIFDELFKGTNVKDAYDATLAVTTALATYKQCMFVVSTHIIEVGEELLKKNGNIQLRYLPTEMNGNIPTYTYKLKEGISADRQGMLIIINEGIFDILEGN